MNIYALFSLLGAIFCFTLTCIVLSKNYHNSANRIFSLLCLAFSFWSFTEFQIKQAESALRASSWITFSGIWPFAIPLLLHFILDYSKFLKTVTFKTVLLLTYIAAVFFAYSNTFLISFSPVHFDWGWGFEFPKSWIYNCSKIWAFCMSLFSIILLCIFSLRTDIRSTRKQTHYILLGIIIVVLSSTFSELLLPLFSIRIPELTHISFTLMAGFVGWAIWRHRLFALNPSTAAETIIGTMSDALAVVDLDHKIEIVNRSLLSMLNYSDHELIGCDLHKITGNFKYQDSTLTTLLKKDSLCDIETTFIKKDGSQIPISLSWSVLKENNIFRGFVFIARDMSERERIKTALQKAHDELEKRVEARTIELKKSNEQLLYEISERTTAEQKLAEEKERLAVTLKSIGDGVITTDLDGNVVLLNKAAEDLIECSLENAIGKNLAEIYHTEQINTKLTHDHDIFFEILNNVYFSLYGRQSLLFTKSQKNYTITETGVPIKDHLDEVIGFVIVFRDITEKYHLGEELFKARKLESISLLASGIAHDFNNLLTGIITNLFMAKMGVENATDTYQLITTAEKAAFQASILTRQLLTFANIDTSSKEDTSIKELIESSIGFYLKESKSEYRLNIPDSIHKVKVDRGQIDKAFNHIILNADQSMPDGGVINVIAENIILDSNNQAIPIAHGNYVKISISDQGTGIPIEILPRIFDPYFSTKKNGTGLGLTAAYTIVQKHGGHISVDSQIGTGTSFTIFLPAVDEPVPEEKNEPTAVDQAQEKILFVDDEQFILKSTGQILNHLGYQVCLAEECQGALQIFKDAYNSDDPFSIVIIDLTISGGPGAKEMIGEFLSIDRDIKVIVSSGYTNDPVMVDFASYGFSGAMPKPYNVEELNSKIREISEMENSTIS
jgi:PAS domain S-box-containing protein